MAAAWAHTQPSASVTHNFDAQVRQGDCSCFLWEDTPQGTCIPQAKCCLYEVLSWLYRRKTKGNYSRGCRAAIPRVSVACFAGRAIQVCAGRVTFLCQAAREECGCAAKPWGSLSGLSWRVGQGPHGPIHPFTQQSHQNTSRSHPNTAKANGCSGRVIPAHPWELMWPNAFWKDSPSRWVQQCGHALA